ncbi:hypothetical protein PV10_03980 [Exophiala mesophila]|uniref:Putative phospholipase n=1 Tax=Exophiala mesophila TaxID=212818 RepID=A0A0D2A0V1_EXOME|nr:uncharacterized protein PV10_03980 [Exophiala mesophila]KIV92708.1 hypothetical protein PV10_03980 [Exophiala mesophila]
MLSFLNPLPYLPPYNGPHKVGTTVYEIPITSLGYDTIPEGFPTSTIKFRVFYPTSPETSDLPFASWLPEPQSAYVDAYLKLARVGPWLSKLLLSIPLYLRSTKVHAYENAPLKSDDQPFPVLIFSHGLVGGANTHSYLLGELASRGVICVALEHRDGSGVLSRANNDGAKKGATEQPSEVTSIFYKSNSLKIRPGVWEQRDHQISIRLFELSATFQALELLNQGVALPNVAEGSAGSNVIPKSSLNLQPGQVTWAAHSFGGATMVQFFKSLYHESRVELLSGVKPDDPLKENSLFLVRPSKSLVNHLTPSTPLILLDPWFMPLRSPRRRELFDKPLPAFESTPADASHQASTIAVLSSECAWHWPEVHSHMPQIFAPEPLRVQTQTEEETTEIFKAFKSPRHFMNESKAKHGASKAIDPIDESQPQPTKMFVLHNTTHVTPSDFGILFPWITWWFTGQEKPVLATVNIVKCILDAAGLSKLQVEIPGFDSPEDKAQLARIA